MRATAMLEQIAQMARHVGPQGQRHDAETLLKMAPSLTEEAARVYLDRFLAKWRLAKEEIELRPPGPRSLSRRRPMDELERAVYLELAMRIPKAANDQRELDTVRITVASTDRDSA